METTNFIALSVIIVTVLGIGVGTMTWAYFGKGSVSVLFKEPILSVPEFPATDAGKKASVYFQEGIEAYQSGNYRQAKDNFTSTIQLISTLAEAYHNRGLAFANLRSDDAAVVDLISASELYQKQDNRIALDLIKQNLEALKKRKLEREKLKAIRT
jgi:tetratricopeptide (TPR) repeat protein